MADYGRLASELVEAGVTVAERGLLAAQLVEAEVTVTERGLLASMVIEAFVVPAVGARPFRENWVQYGTTHHVQGGS
jgi:hypothetical protein